MKRGSPPVIPAPMQSPVQGSAGVPSNVPASISNDHPESPLTTPRPTLWAVINLTNDSFFEPSRAPAARSAVDLALAAVKQGADILDLGAESTRPGSVEVPPDQQLAKLLPAIKAIRESGVEVTAGGGSSAAIPLSIDTSSAKVAASAIDLGASIINDTSAGRDDPAMLRLIADRGVRYVLMHRLTKPSKDSYSDRYTTPPIYKDVVEDVIAFLRDRVEACNAAGIARDRIILDPGLGFGKTVEQNLALIAATPRIMRELNLPILSALSRKSFVGRVSLDRDSDPSERLAGTLALSVSHHALGASNFRVHDMREHREALDAAWRLQQATRPATPPCQA